MTTTPPTQHDETISDELIDLLVHQHSAHNRPAFERLWDYYRNELDFDSEDPSRVYEAAQAAGLPQRLGGREVVIENDIAWRLHTMVDFMFGKPVTIESAVTDRDRAAVIERVLHAAFESAGGACFFQNMALLGGVYGFVDVVVRAADVSGTRTGRAPSKTFDIERAIALAESLTLETVEAPRAVPVLDASDYRKLAGYALHFTKVLNEVDEASWWSRVVGGDGASLRGRRQHAVEITEVWTDEEVRIWQDGLEVSRAVNLLGVLPVVHIQNLPQPLFYEGIGEVEPLIPLQDELNTRLSDRANRVTLQSFKMYLGKGIDGFIERPVGPGQMWMTDNPNACIESFGGDAHNPSEEAHINEIRDAMDKTSGVSPLAAGLLQNKVGNLTSENALRVTLMGLLAKTQRKRVTYGKGIEQICGLILHALHVAGVLRTEPAERRVRLHWPSPLPENTEQRLHEAKQKLELGVPRERVLAEIGYCGVD